MSRKEPTEEEPGVSVSEYQKWQGELRNECPSPEAWRKMLLELRRGAVLYTDENADPRVPVGLDSVMHVIVEIYTFINAHEIVQRERLSDPLVRLGQAFVDLGHGRQPELFTPAEGGVAGAGGRQAASSELNLQAIAARALDELHKAGGGAMAKPAAALKVATAIKAGRIPGYRDCTAKTVINWLDRCKRAERGTAKVPALLLDRWSAPLPPHVGPTHKERAEFLLDALRQGRGFHWR